jgi:phage terminase small subunit
MSTTVAEDKLLYKERLFVSYFLGESNGNATDAARRAGYVHPNKIGPRLAVKVGIRAAIEARLAGPALSAAETLARLSEQATADMGDFVSVVGDVARVDLATAKRRGKLHLVRKLKQGRYGPELELYSAQAALELLARHHGLLGRKDDDDDDHDDEAARAEIARRLARLAEPGGAGGVPGGPGPGDAPEPAP